LELEDVLVLAALAVNPHTLAVALVAVVLLLMQLLQSLRVRR